MGLNTLSFELNYNMTVICPKIESEVTEGQTGELVTVHSIKQLKMSLHLNLLDCVCFLTLHALQVKTC